MFIFQVHHFIKPEMIDAYKVATLENARQTLQEPGVIRFDVLQDKADPTHFSLFEAYRDKAAQEAHLQTAHFLAWKEVALQAFAKRGFGYEFEALKPTSRR
jgi:(4S)-4-hydroxy-5-phosphonooxypentane-2,3-dione isomerase